MFVLDAHKKKVQDILVATGLDFTIHKQAMTTLHPVTGFPMATPYFALINSKTEEVINSVKKGYTISQNEEIISMIVKGTERFSDQLEIVTGGPIKGGSINGGRKVFLQLRIKGDAKVGNDTVQKYITIIDSNDGSTGLSVGIGDYTMSCRNQFYHFYRNGHRSRHTKTLTQKVAMLPSLIEEALEESMVMMNRYKAFQSTPCSREMAHKMVNAVMGFDKATMTHEEYAELSTRQTNAMDALYRNIEMEMNSKGNNVWGLHSGVTRWTTHEKSAPKRENGRVESIVNANGTNYKTNQKSLAFAMQLADVG
jgi:hypothetical protein